MTNNNHTPVLIAGPCVIESQDLLNEVAARLVAINKQLGTNIIFKASFDKANRTSIHSFRGPGLERGRLLLPVRCATCSRYPPFSAGRPIFW